VYIDDLQKVLDSTPGSDVREPPPAAVGGIELSAAK
jgi:hypothetical protein